MNDVAIIGAGPAGIACAIQLTRCGMRPLLFERNIPGGLLKNANLIENFPGFPGGISGVHLAGKMTRQLRQAKIPIIKEEVSQVSFHNAIFQIKTNRNEYFAGILVIASGTIPYGPAGLTVPENIRQKVFFEVYPLRKVRNAKIIIIGAGDAAFDYALQLAFYNKVMIMNRSDRVKCLPLLEQRAKGNEQISYFKNHVLSQIMGEPSSSCLKVSFQNENKLNTFPADYIIFATGRRPELSFANPALIQRFDELQHDGKLYLAGDVKNDLLRQASIAAGDGIRAAMEIYLNESHKKNKA